MTALAEQEPTTEQAAQPQAPSPQQLAKKLKQTMAAVRLAKSKWHLTKKLERGQVNQAAEGFHADPRYIGASKKLINSRNDKYRACGAVLSEAREYWKSVTIPFPEDGVRLIRRDRMQQFADTMQQFKQDLLAAAGALQGDYDAIREEARARLGDLFCEHDYPADVACLFSLHWEYPSVEPPSYLMEADPTGKLYEQQVALMEARFQEAIALTEEAFTKSFRDMVEHLADRLKFGDVDPETGNRKPLVFKDSSIENLQSFFEQFKALNVGSSPDLDSLVSQAQQIVGDKTAKDLRKDVTLRQNVQAGMAEITAKLDALMVARPIRQMNLLDEE